MGRLAEVERQADKQDSRTLRLFTRMAAVESKVRVLESAKPEAPNRDVVKAMRERDAALADVERRKVNDLYMSTWEIQAGIDRRIAAEAEVERLKDQLAGALDTTIDRVRANLLKSGHAPDPAGPCVLKPEDIPDACIKAHQDMLFTLAGLIERKLDQPKPKTETVTKWQVDGLGYKSIHETRPRAANVQHCLREHSSEDNRVVTIVELQVEVSADE